MSEIGPAQGRPQSDIYTVLLILATLFLLLATVLTAVYSQRHFGTWLPIG